MKTLRMWLPYSLPVIFAVAYRSLVYTHPGFGYSLQDELLRAPAAASLDLLGRVLSGLWAAAGAAWLQAFQFPVFEVNGVRTTVLYIVVVAAAGAIAWLLKRSNEAAGDGSRAEARWLLGSGALLLILGGAAFWATNIPVTLSFPANRATLSFMLGACFFLMGLIDLLPAQVRVPAAILLVALSAGRQFLWSVDYMREWDTQKSLFWQMTWRAPGLQPGTMVLLNEGALHFNADNSLSTALNSIYAPDLDYSGSVPYLLFYPTNRLDGSLPFLEPGHAILYNYWAGRFTGSTSQVVSFFYMPPGCLRLLDPVIDRENHFIPDRYLLREGAALSSAEWIETTTSSRMPAIYGPEPAHGWCWYFEKADLARQEGDWQQAAALGDQAFASGDHPNDPSERFVFIESYAHTGDWERAVEVSLESHRVSPKYVDPMLCKLWDRIALQTEGGAERIQAVEKIRTKLACRGE